MAESGRPMSMQESKCWYLIIAVLLCINIMGCNKHRPPWHLDADYSTFLTIKAPNYKAMTGTESADTVDAIRIYKLEQKHRDMYELSDLMRKQFVYETTDKTAIRKIILSAQRDVPNVLCDVTPDKNMFHLVAFDNKFMRAGYFLFNVCLAKGEEYVVIQPLQRGGGSSMYYNKELLRILRNDTKLVD